MDYLHIVFIFKNNINFANYVFQGSCINSSLKIKKNKVKGRFVINLLNTTCKRKAK